MTLEVEFVLLGDTVEYSQYKALQHVCLHDNVKILTDKSGMQIEAKVTEYQWDCLKERYYSIKVGTVNSYSKRVPGYRVVNNSITYSKLSPGLVNKIRETKTVTVSEE